MRQVHTRVPKYETPNPRPRDPLTGAFSQVIGRFLAHLASQHPEAALHRDGDQRLPRRTGGDQAIGQTKPAARRDRLPSQRRLTVPPATSATVPLDSVGPRAEHDVVGRLTPGPDRRPDRRRRTARRCAPSWSPHSPRPSPRTSLPMSGSPPGTASAGCGAPRWETSFCSPPTSTSAPLRRQSPRPVPQHLPAPAARTQLADGPRRDDRPK